MTWGRYRLEFGGRTLVMGILNVTPDSFSDGGRYLSVETAVAHGQRLVAEGADILDIGGESTRPFSEGIDVEEEVRRVLPVIDALAGQVAVPISIDTTKAEVARQAIAAGAAMINDVSALTDDPLMGRVAAEAKVPVVLMHREGTPRTMQRNPEYANLLAEVTAHLRDALNRAVAAGIDRDLLMVDPGIGFGKTGAHNLEILARLREFAALKVPVLVGTSRKAFIRRLLTPPDGPEPVPDGPEVLAGTQATVATAILNGAHVVRVHDVAATRLTASIVDAIVTTAGDATPSAHSGPDIRSESRKGPNP